jgi:hypothetical protein
MRWPQQWSLRSRAFAFVRGWSLRPRTRAIFVIVAVTLGTLLYNFSNTNEQVEYADAVERAPSPTPFPTVPPRLLTASSGMQTSAGPSISTTVVNSSPCPTPTSQPHDLLDFLKGSQAHVRLANADEKNLDWARYKSRNIAITCVGLVVLTLFGFKEGTKAEDE